MGADDLLWQRQQRSLRRAAPGTLGGRVESPGRLAVRRPQLEKAAAGGSVVVDIPPFSYAGALATTTKDDCPPWAMDAAIAGLAAVARLAVAGSTQTIITVYKNGTSIGTITLAASDTDQDASLATAFAVGDLLQVATTTAGTGAKSVVVTFSVA